MNQSFSETGRHTLEGTIRVFLAEALILPTGIITAAFLARRLGPEGYGLFALAATLVAWIEWSITSIFARATIKLVGETEAWQPVGGAGGHLPPLADSSAHSDTLAEHLDLWAGLCHGHPVACLRPPAPFEAAGD